MVQNPSAIKYYGSNDWSVGHFLEQSEPIIRAFDAAKVYTDINDVIELYNIQQLMDSGVLLTKWDAQTVELLKDTCKQFPAVIGRFFSRINEENLASYFQSLNISYIDDFWTLFSKFKVFKRIQGSVFMTLLTEENASLHRVLEHKEIVKHYDSELASFMRTSDQTATLLMDHFLADGKKPYYFPASLQPEEYEGIFEDYINSDAPNPNYLALLADSQSSKECPFSTKLVQKAKRRHNAAVQKLFQEKNSGFKFGVSVSFGDIDSHVKIENINDLTPQITFSTKWIQENLDYPTLLNNFRYLFEQVDGCWRSNLVSVKTQMRGLEKLIGIKGKKEYRFGTFFRFQDMSTLAQIRGYREVLSSYGVDIEDIFRWFFEEYLKGEFNAEGFSFRPSSTGTSFLEKCRNLASEMDGVLKQYRAFLEDGFIDRELFEMRSEHVVFSELPSFIPNKYAYSNSDDTEKELFFLYSDQSLLHYTEKTEAKYETIVDMLRAEDMTIEDFQYYQASAIQWLIARGSICEGDDHILKIDEDRVSLLKDLFDHDVICPSYYRQRRKSILESMITNGDLRYESTLFSRPEQAYLNFQLNRAEFSNGLDLRNKYIHSSYSQDAQVQEQDYDRLLRIMALVVMKINEEFCLKYPVEF